MVNALKDYEKARIAVANMFGHCDLWHNLVDGTDEPWCDYGSMHNEVGYGGEVEDGELNAEYSFEVYGTSRWVSKCGEYTLFVGNDGCGNRDMYLLKNCNKVEE